MEGIVSKIKTTNKRAFTLTELLIVVIVIGVLSAVTLPKFNRVIENRKVTEAEEMMSAVRTEQERRCTLDQNYTTNFDSLSDVIASANTKNYTYSLQSQGISAKSNSGDYTLKILSYEDGSYCCTGEGCKKLNKNYPDCATLSFPTSNCVGTEGGVIPPGPGPTPTEPIHPIPPHVTPECADGAVQGSQTCNGCGTQTTQKCVNGQWEDVLGSCSKTVEECTPKPQCTGNQPADATKQCECGVVTAPYYCDASTNYQWVQKEFPECPAKPEPVAETCPDGITVRVKPYSCVNNVWVPSPNWTNECPSVCTPTNGEKYTEKCPDGQVGTLTYTWDTESCTYKKTGMCNTYELRHDSTVTGPSQTYFYVTSEGCTESACRSHGAPKTNFRTALPECPSNAAALCRTTGKVNEGNGAQECWDSQTRIKIRPQFTAPGCYCYEDYIQVARCVIKY